MKRSGPLQRKTPLRGNPQKTREWKDRSRKEIPKRTSKRRLQESTYGGLHKAFLAKYPTCPVMGTPATEVHHSARRRGKWLNLQRYWISLSREVHDWVEANSKEAAKYCLMYPISPSITYEEHIRFLEEEGLSLTEPIFYELKNDNDLLELREKINSRLQP